ncbi:hypothetical protein BDV06DRAFT_205466 [Aspergillus oleicola]
MSGRKTYFQMSSFTLDFSHQILEICQQASSSICSTLIKRVHEDKDRTMIRPLNQNSRHEILKFLFHPIPSTCFVGSKPFFPISKKLGELGKVLRERFEHAVQESSE